MLLIPAPLCRLVLIDGLIVAKVRRLVCEVGYIFGTCLLVSKLRAAFLLPPKHSVVGAQNSLKLSFPAAQGGLGHFLREIKRSKVRDLALNLRGQAVRSQAKMGQTAVEPS